MEPIGHEGLGRLLKLEEDLYTPHIVFSKEDLTKLILIMFYSFKSYDFVNYLIRIMDKKFNLNLIEQYIELSPSFKILRNY